MRAGSVDHEEIERAQHEELGNTADPPGLLPQAQRAKSLCVKAYKFSLSLRFRKVGRFLWERKSGCQKLIETISPAERKAPFGEKGGPGEPQAG